jgi:heme/copper-type cytochrome/quinol oxidase subunit 1
LFACGAALSFALITQLGSQPQPAVLHSQFRAYFVVVHAPLLWGSAILQAIFAVVYLTFPRLTHGSFRQTLGRLHFWLTGMATALIVSAPFLVSKMQFERSADIEEFVAAGPVFLLMGQLPFLLLFAKSKGKAL